MMLPLAPTGHAAALFALAVVFTFAALLARNALK